MDAQLFERLQRAYVADMYQRANVWWNRLRIRVGAAIMGGQYLGVIMRLWLIRDRAMKAVTADGRVALADCPALAEVLYEPMPGQWSMTVTRISRSKHADNGAARVTTSRPAPSYRSQKRAGKLRKNRRRQWGTTLPHSTKRPKKANAARRKKEFLRAYGSKERVTWVKQQACFVCSAVPSENVHYVTGGTGRKADYTTIVPLCTPHHRMLHRVGLASFNSMLLTDLKALAEYTERRWQQFQEFRWAAQGETRE